MDGIILAGGHGTRMRPLTDSTPKPLLPLQDRAILHWSLRSLRGVVERALVVVHYRADQIAAFMERQTLFNDYALVEQPRPLGTGHALRCCQAALRSDDFLVVNGDDLYASEGLRMLSRTGFGVLSSRRDDYARFGVLVQDESDSLLRIDEKPPLGRYPAPAPCNIGAYKLGRAVFKYAPEPSPRGEYEITDYVSALARERAVSVVETPFWLPIGDPAALAAAQDRDLERWIPPVE